MKMLVNILNQIFCLNVNQFFLSNKCTLYTFMTQMYKTYDITIFRRLQNTRRYTFFLQACASIDDQNDEILTM